MSSYANNIDLYSIGTRAYYINIVNIYSNARHCICTRNATRPHDITKK